MAKKKKLHWENSLLPTSDVTGVKVAAAISTTIELQHALQVLIEESQQLADQLGARQLMELELELLLRPRCTKKAPSVETSWRESTFKEEPERTEALECQPISPPLDVQRPRNTERAIGLHQVLLNALMTLGPETLQVHSGGFTSVALMTSWSGDNNKSQEDKSLKDYIQRFLEATAKTKSINEDARVMSLIKLEEAITRDKESKGGKKKSLDSQSLATEVQGYGKKGGSNRGKRANNSGTTHECYKTLLSLAKKISSTAMAAEGTNKTSPAAMAPGGTSKTSLVNVGETTKTSGVKTINMTEMAPKAT
uniref:Uncharacterized protein n=1 Tax=Cannabis sativa TaxID=3483 RepID=A0A803Q9A2_CANSA